MQTHIYICLRCKETQKTRDHTQFTYRRTASGQLRLSFTSRLFPPLCHWTRLGEHESSRAERSANTRAISICEQRVAGSFVKLSSSKLISLCANTELRP